METAKLKKFAQFARRTLIEQVSTRLNQVLAENSPSRRERASAVEKLEENIQRHGQEQVVERVAYIWFNRFCALRFMDVNRYTRIGVVSPAEGQFQPEILAEAKMGHIDEALLSDKTRQQVFALLNGTAPSRDPQGEAYRLLLIGACNFWHKAMPFLFERIADYTELLLPDDLLSGNSILAYTREAMTPADCRDVEVIGWLYQFYISEKKDAVFAGLKKNQKITPENIPAVTQLFTPHWIVRYLVENSLGRLWMLNRPNSRLSERMDYYIKPEQPETDFLRIGKPEEIKICDPACGSGHMLTYAFDLLYAIYEEEGYDPAQIPGMILTHNLYGIEIDERAGELSAFALTMKARARQRTFFRKLVQPNICVLGNIHFEEKELKEYMDFVGHDLFTASFQTTLSQFEEAENFGSLIRPEVTDVESMLEILEETNLSGDLFLSPIHSKVLQVLRQADYLSPKYHVVIANPPYMGKKNMNARLAAWAKKTYSIGKLDLFAMFIERNMDLAKKHGLISMITMQSWMFLPSFEALRGQIIKRATILAMAHFGARAFDSIGGEVVATTAFILRNTNITDYKGHYLRLVDGNSEAEKDKAIRGARINPLCGWSYYFTSADFEKIPGKPIVYWVSKKFVEIFSSQTIGGSKKISALVGLFTCNNELFMRNWHEISLREIDLNARKDNDFIHKKWVPYNKGGNYRKWYGNFDYVVNYYDKGRLISNYREESGQSYSLPGKSNYFEEGITWTDLTSGNLSVRYLPSGFIYDVSGHTSIFSNNEELYKILGYCNTSIVNLLSKIINTTFHFQIGDYKKLPYPSEINHSNINKIKQLVDLAQDDWNSYENSWCFTCLPILHPNYHQPTLKATYQKLYIYWQEVILQMQLLEEENNRIFIKVYGLQDELTPEVPLSEITLTCNPHYRYGENKIKEELEALQLADTMREFISYAVGCMFGRYALEKPGLILANQGETIEDYLARVPEPSFPADDDNVIPMLDGDWFTDDISERFRRFLKVTFGETHYEENLKFIEAALGKDIRKYFLRDFYNDHVKRYKKRPIYWLFSSPGGSFNALIYMHRYRLDTVSVVLNDYLREFRVKLSSRLEYLKRVDASAGTSQSEKTRALKETEKLKQVIAELDNYEREILYPLATQQVAIDLDDGVKVNYARFGEALKKIPGLEAKEK
ncbi:MAG: BREX-1 system adenine-specific DNA-methyltransferase PglX [Calditrichaeota bacterium]|nr:BREX-1 system adenine-specific DNA-methyltransferase PglX [Calditrichota bacterium]MCB0305009.1 BREX-1 system adenine-specific DNA-methyltransferase PglX [Calditrichota bacterium]